MNELAPKFQHTRAWLLAGLAAVFMQALPNLRYPIGEDHATFCMIGQGILEGKLPYRDLWDIKPPGIYYVYALIVKIFGPVMWCLGVVDILWLLLISCCIFYFARRYLGTPAAALAMVFNATLHCRQGYIHAAQPETFLMLCVFGAWFLLWGRDPSRPVRGGPSTQGSEQNWTLRVARCFAAGLLMGAAFWLKYNAIVFFPFLLLVPFLDFREWDRGSSQVRMEIPWKDWLARMSTVAAGFLFAVLGVLAYFWSAGVWPAFKEGQLEVLPRFAAGHFQWNFSQESFSFLVSALRLSQTHLGIWTEIMASLSLLIAWRRRELACLAPVALMAFAGYICAAMQGQFNSYYFETCYPFFAMFWGYVCVKTWEGFRDVRRVFEQRGWTLARPLLWLVFAGVVFPLFPEESARVIMRYEFLADWWRDPELSYKVYPSQLLSAKLSQQLCVVDFLKKNSNPEDEVYMWGFAPLINFLAQRRNPSRFMNDFPLVSNWGLESWRQEVVRTLETKRPRYIVVERNDSVPQCTHTILDSEQCLRLGAYPGLAALMSRQYRPAVNYSDFEVYELKKRSDSKVQTPKSEGHG